MLYAVKGADLIVRAVCDNGMIAGTVFGLADEWMRRGMQETPEQILALAAQLDAQKQSI